MAVEVALALLQALQLAVEGLGLLVVPAFLLLQLGAALAVFVLGAGLDALGFLLGLCHDAFRLVPGLGDHLGRLSLGQAHLTVENEAPGNERGRAAENQADDEAEE